MTPAGKLLELFSIVSAIYRQNVSSNFSLYLVRREKDVCNLLELNIKMRH